MTYSLAPYRSLGGSSPEIRPKFWWSLLHQSGLTHTPDLQWHKKLLCLPNISYKTSQCCLFFYPVSGDLGFDFGFKWLQITIIPRAVSQHTQSKLAIWPGVLRRNCSMSSFPFVLWEVHGRTTAETWNSELCNPELSIFGFSTIV